MHTVLTMCTLFTLKSVSKQARSLDTFFCHSSSWNTRCGRVVALQKVYKNLFSLYLISFLVLFEARKKKTHLQLRDLAISFLMAQRMDDFKSCCTNKITVGKMHDTPSYLEMGHGSGWAFSPSLCISALVKCFVLSKDIKDVLSLLVF